MISPWYINFSIATALQIVLCWRAIRARLWPHYPFFYSYLVYTTLRSIAFAFPKVVRQPGYGKIFWWSYLLAALLRFGVVAEVYRYVFPGGTTLRRSASIAILCATVLLGFGFWIIPASGLPFPDVMRKLALSVGVLILIILGIARYYQVRIGRNIWGMAVGILTFTGSEIVYLAAMDLLPSFWAVWRLVHPITFVFALMVWTAALWRYDPNPHVPSLDESLAQEFLMAWRDRWTQVPNLVRRVGKP
jgi:hypothetical protein